MIQGGGRKFYPGRHFVFEIISTTHTHKHWVTYRGGAHLKRKFPKIQKKFEIKTNILTSLVFIIYVVFQYPCTKQK